MTMVPTKSSNWVTRAPGDIERIEAFFSGVAYSPHRHDTYAIGITLGGVQSFDYRGAARHSQPGCTVILHPDEKHDGRAGTAIGFSYRVIYIEPMLIQSVLGGKPLPFIEGGVSSDPNLYQASFRLLADFDRALEPFEYEDALYELATAMDSVSGRHHRTDPTLDCKSAALARQYLSEHLHEQVTMGDLESITGCDRWKLSRNFRTLYGTSPYRYLVMRRLDRARKMMLGGKALSEVAASCEFADQSHMIRHFKKTFGMTPRQWMSTLNCK